MVLSADTVIDPWAMVIEPLNTSVTDAAMPRPGCSNDFAVWAQEHWVETLEHILNQSMNLCLR
mgnify:CR=1 FL=1